MSLVAVIIVSTIAIAASVRARERLPNIKSSSAAAPHKRKLSVLIAIAVCNISGME